MIQPTTTEAPAGTAFVNPPKQSRSRRTLDRIVNASLELLAEQGPSGLTVQAVVKRANSSVGSFYARFKGKDDLLDYLGARVWDEALERWNEALASRDWSDLELGALAEGAAGLLIDTHRSRSTYLTALDHVGAHDDAYTNFRGQLIHDLGELLLTRRDSIAHENPDRGVRLGLMATLGMIEGASLFVADPMDRGQLVTEATRLLIAYLVGGLGDTGDSSVDFFEVWG